MAYFNGLYATTILPLSMNIFSEILNCVLVHADLLVSKKKAILYAGTQHSVVSVLF